MILCVTMNPSVDIAYQISHFETDAVNRVSDTLKTPGGKGLNVARVLYEAGEDVLASGMIAGKNGEYLQMHLDESGIRSDFYETSGETRNCIAILHDGMQTEILEAGPLISQDEYEGFLEHFRLMLSQAEAAVFSGSLPRGIAPDYYARMIKICVEKDIPCVLDCSNKALAAAINAEEKPTVIKPNIDELSWLLGRKIKPEVSELKDALGQERFAGIEWIIVSLGKDGCFAAHHNHYYKADIPVIHAVNPVGSGDSTVAGIASGLVHGLSDEELLKRANTFGMLNAMEKQTGHINMEHYDELYQNITITEV